MRIQTIIILFWGLMMGACNPSEINQENHLNQDSATQLASKRIVASDPITKLLDNAIKVDTLEYLNTDPFIFFKSGYFLNNKYKNALVVTKISDTSITVKLYSIKSNNWVLTSSLENIDGPGMSFRLMFQDFNFDGQTDIFIRVSVSNGYTLSRGQLIIIDPLTNKLNFHQEASDLANMRPDKKTHSVISEEVILCKSNLHKEIGVWTNKWVNGQLKTIKKEYPCELLK